MIYRHQGRDIVINVMTADSWLLMSTPDKKLYEFAIAKLTKLKLMRTSNYSDEMTCKFIISRYERRDVPIDSSMSKYNVFSKESGE